MDPKVREIMEKVKATAMTAAEAAGKAADVASKKAGELLEVTKLNLQVFDLNTEIEIAFKEIGRNVYLTHTGADVDPQVIEEKISAIDEKYARIAEIKKDLASKKRTVVCPNCGKECEKDDIFCRICGTSL